ncbi:uncharacterized protein LOC115810911 isoform X2 [Chanos chanos]|uniref:Uncharacterized protein LOC115810911 isoform X2 n=1 Tax=Chanos chanos TaxID=29144 RepID=A0A6J2VA69_CHACN|nr:uncharacterized protein LOC115810911 isoform X2 [Chanos chanos]
MINLFWTPGSGPQKLKYVTKICGNTLNVHEDFKRRLHEKLECLCEVDSEMECDFILAFCPVVSRAGTDIEAALEKIPDFKPSVLVVLHYTRDSDAIVPDCSSYTTNRNILTAVNCLFHEDYGLLRCQRNISASHQCVQELRNCFPVTERGVSFWQWWVLLARGISQRLRWRTILKCSSIILIVYVQQYIMKVTVNNEQTFELILKYSTV